ncbi:unnamed protein product [Boreogadus saida]
MQARWESESAFKENAQNLAIIAAALDPRFRKMKYKFRLWQLKSKEPSNNWQGLKKTSKSWLDTLLDSDSEGEHSTEGIGQEDSVLECRYCLRQEERANESPMVAALQTTEAAQTIGEAQGWLPLSARQLEQQQRADKTLVLVRDCLEAGQRPSWP